MSILLKNGRNVVNEPIEILIEADRIVKIATEIEVNADELIDLQGNFVSPGLVDVHVHLREPGFTDKETIASGTLAAAHGGFTTICAMPNLQPVPDSVENLAIEQKLIASSALVKVLPYAAISMNRTSNEPVEFAELAQVGVFAFSNDGDGLQETKAVYLSMQAATKLNKAIVAHAEDLSLMNLLGTKGVIRAGKRAQELALPEWNPLVEASQVARDLTIAEATGVHYHLCHVSTKESLQLIREAKARGVQVTCEVAPHHLILCDEDIPADDALYKMNPPLASAEDRAALIAGLLDGTIDMIATDHAPHTQAEKTGSFRTGAFGIVGIEQAFALIYTHFVRTGLVRLDQIIDWMSVQPAKKFAIQDAGGLKVGDKADLAVFDLEKEFLVKAADFKSKGTNSPFLGKKLFGETKLTLVNGKIVWR